MNGKKKILPLTEEEMGTWNIYLQTNGHHSQLNLICFVSCTENLHNTTCVWQGLDVFLANKYDSEDMQQTIRVTSDPGDRSATLA